MGLRKDYSDSDDPATPSDEQGARIPPFELSDEGDRLSQELAGGSRRAAVMIHDGDKFTFSITSRSATWTGHFSRDEIDALGNLLIGAREIVRVEDAP